MSEPGDVSMLFVRHQIVSQPSIPFQITFFRSCFCFFEALIVSSSLSLLFLSLLVILLYSHTACRCSVVCVLLHCGHSLMLSSLLTATAASSEWMWVLSGFPCPINTVLFIYRLQLSDKKKWKGSFRLLFSFPPFSPFSLLLSTLLHSPASPALFFVCIVLGFVLFSIFSPSSSTTPFFPIVIFLLHCLVFLPSTSHLHQIDIHPLSQNTVVFLLSFLLVLISPQFTHSLSHCFSPSPPTTTAKQNRQVSGINRIPPPKTTTLLHTINSQLTKHRPYPPDNYH
ncbi:MAG: hypothetical protein JOS17DRAFT_405989 [Linnemannia elongata]|nr:MAG: hypothetical protein JOS17DRAFT_405989 [Linnemannia elongata]